MDNTKALDNILSAYHLFANRIPAIKDSEEFINERLQVVKFLESMYLDLLKFHQKVVRLLEGKGKRTFIGEDSQWLIRC